jgi:hypothetical protein
MEMKYKVGRRIKSEACNRASPKELWRKGKIKRIFW